MSIVGFIGLGIMGSPMAKNLIDKGCKLFVNDVDPCAVEKLVAYGAKYASLERIGMECQMIFTVLPSDDIVKAVICGEEGIGTVIKPETVVVDCSSITPTQARQCSEFLHERGCEYLDAPVSGGEPKAVDATLSIMVGGDEKTFNKVLPYLLMIGSSAEYIGESGSGCITKLANQIIVNLTIAAVSEALVLAAKAGVEPNNVYKAIRRGLAGSAVLEAKAPLMIHRQFEPGGKLSINLKDIKNVMGTAHDINVPLPLSSYLLEIMQALKVKGHLNEDHSAIIKYYEDLADIQIDQGINREDKCETKK